LTHAVEWKKVERVLPFNFKGLERPAVIVTDLRLVSNLYERRMHIAVSRALSLLRIVGVEKEIGKDSVLSVLGQIRGT